MNLFIKGYKTGKIVAAMTNPDNNGLSKGSIAKKAGVTLQDMNICLNKKVWKRIMLIRVIIVALYISKKVINNYICAELSNSDYMISKEAYHDLYSIYDKLKIYEEIKEV